MSSWFREGSNLALPRVFFSFIQSTVFVSEWKHGKFRRNYWLSPTASYQPCSWMYCLATWVIHISTSTDWDATHSDKRPISGRFFHPSQSTEWRDWLVECENRGRLFFVPWSFHCSFQTVLATNARMDLWVDFISPGTQLTDCLWQCFTRWNRQQVALPCGQHFWRWRKLPAF